MNTAGVCLWCDRDCIRCGYPIDGGWEHVEQVQPAGSGLIICKARRVVRPLVDTLTGYLSHQHQRSGL